MPTVVDLGAIGAQGFIAVGDDDFDFAGWSVSDAGDVNGDGFDDIVVGSRTGAAYVVFGQAAGFDTTNLGNLQPADGFLIESNYGDFAGLSVSAAGDVNGDGFDDLIIGGFSYSYYGWYYYSSIPTAYVIFGQASGFSTVNVSELAGSDGFKINGLLDYTFGELSVASAGDVNGDGFDDLIVGSTYEGEGVGAAYVIFGKSSGFGVVDLATLSSATGFKISNPGSFDFIGFSVSGAGDVNGDGFDDLIIGVPYGNDGGPYAGEAYVIFGKATGFGTIDLSNLAPGAGFVIQGDETGDNAGFSVSAAGDVNGDGFADIVIGAPYGDSGGTHSGQAYVIFGKATGFGTIDLTNLAPGAGFIIQGDDTGDHTGWSVSAAGDVNGDGFGDIIVGAPGNDNTRGGAPRVIDAGEAYVIFGKANGFGTIDLTNLAPSDGFIIQGEAAYDLAGWSVSAAGDVDGDGFDDLVVGAPQSDRGGPQAGVAYVISGRLNFATDVRNDFNGDGRSDVLWRNDNGAFSVWHGQGDGGFVASANSNSLIATSWHVVGSGDFNGDGRDDVLWRNDSGAFSAWHGQSNGGFVASVNSNTVISTSWQVVGTGDFNGDGRDDVLWRHDSGALSAWHGRTDGSFVASADSNESIAVSWQVVGTGDFNGDKRDDILLRSNTGDFTAWHGQADGGFVASANSNTVISPSWEVAGTGDFNGDGLDDVLWRHDSGAFSAWHGQANGGFIASANSNTSVAPSWDVVGTGDFNGDGRDDVVWRDDSGAFSVWHGLVDGGFTASANSNSLIPTSWQVQPDLII